MTFDYAKSAATSLKLLTKFGRSVTRRTYTAAAYDPATGTSTPTTADTARIGALFDYNDKTSQGQQYVRGTMVIAGDKQLLLDAEGSAAVTDHYVVGSTEYTVVSMAEINPAGTPVLYDLHLRLS